MDYRWAHSENDNTQKRDVDKEANRKGERGEPQLVSDEGVVYE